MGFAEDEDYMLDGSLRGVGSRREDSWEVEKVFVPRRRKAGLRGLTEMESVLEPLCRRKERGEWRRVRKGPE